MKTLAKIFAPSKFDGPFWILWIWIFVPGSAIFSAVYWGLGDINWWIVAGSFYAMTMGVTLGFHRYFSHHAFRTNRVVQFLLGFFGTVSGQTGPISWSLLHKDHHENCETDKDPHSTNESFLHAHGFFLWSHEQPRRADFESSEWSKYPEIVLMEILAPSIYYSAGIVLLITLGFKEAAWYWGVPSFLAWNTTMMINSFGHKFGSFPYRDFYQAEACNATNVWWAWPLLLGDNFHNNHHAYPNAAAHGWEWWEIDPNKYVLWVMTKLGLVWRPIKPSQRVLDNARVGEGELRPLHQKRKDRERAAAA